MSVNFKRKLDEDKERPGLTPSLSLKISPMGTGQTNKDEIDAWRDRTNNRTGSTSNNGGTSTGTTTLSPLQQAAQNKADAEAAVKSHGKFSYTYQDQLDDVMNQILNREKFSYDLNGDALYRQYADKFAQQGQMAMMDTMGQAQAMTGGYANSYAQTVGQQAYQAQLQKLNDIVPDLYQMALDRYDAEGNELLNKYGLLTDDYNREYGEYSDKYNKLLTERDYANNEYANEYNKSIPEDTTISSIEEIQGWRDAVLGAETEAEAMSLIEKLETIDPALAYELYDLLQEKHTKKVEEGSDAFFNSLMGGLGILGVK